MYFMDTVLMKKMQKHPGKRGTRKLKIGDGAENPAFIKKLGHIIVKNQRSLDQRKIQIVM